MTEIDLFELEEQVNSRETFLRFLKALELDFIDSAKKERESPSNPYGPAANGWNNVDVAGFLEAMSGWASDNEMDEAPSWREFARLLHEGKLYE